MNRCPCRPESFHRLWALGWARWAQSALPHPIVIGQVQLWGRVLPHSAGYRAELAYPYELEVLHVLLHHLEHVVEREPRCAAM